MANGEAVGPSGLRAELLELGFVGEPREILCTFHGIVVIVRTSDEVPQCRRSGAPQSKFYERAGCADYGGVPLNC